MSSPSNLYAEKVFAEHPIGLWALDDKADYLDLMPQDQSSLVGWLINGGDFVSETLQSSSPFPNMQVSTISKALEATFVECISQDVFNFKEFNNNLKTFSFGTYLYSKSNIISSIDIGYEYFDTTTGSKVQNLKNFIPKIMSRWMFLSETFEIPNENTTFRFVIKVNYISIPDADPDQTFLINGLTLGQWSEEFNSSSSGVVGQPLPSGLGFSNSDLGVAAYAYGLDDDHGYYIISNNSLKAKNTGLPIVYGAKGITKLLPNNNKPSLILPGKGFLTENGKHKDYTFEMWIRLLNDSSEPKKVFGSILSDDGLWVDGPFIILKINNYIGSYFVGEWGKPMLIDIKYSKNGSSLMINGDTVIELEFDSDNLIFPASDWLGFWAYDDVSPVEIDCIAIYSYLCANIVAKRRFVYGQGVDFPENINTSYSGSSVFIDYQFANYSNNYMYPDLGKWNHGIRNNVSVDNNILSTPNYSLPRLVLESGSQTEFETYNFNDQYQSQEIETCFSFKNNNGYLVFDNFNFLQEDVQAFYAIIKPIDEMPNEETVLHIQSDSTQNYFSITLKDNKINYNLLYNGVLETLYTGIGFNLGDSFPIGINIKTFTEYFGEKSLAFFGNRGDLRFYVGGTPSFGKSFHGKFYAVSFSNASNLNEISNLFNDRGCVLEFEDVFNLYSQYVDYDAGVYTGNDPNFWQFILDGGLPSDYPMFRLHEHVSSYTLFVNHYFNKYYFDIAAKGYWKDYIPLTTLAKYVKDSNGKSYYDLDFIQFNIDYPAPSKYIEQSGSPISWNYGTPVEINGQVIPSLQEEFSTPNQKTYLQLDNHLYTGYNDYTDLKTKSSKSYLYDTSNSFIKSYVMFEYADSGPAISDIYFSNVVRANKDGVTIAGNEWINTKYEVVDGSIIYPPLEDINSLIMTTKIQFTIRGMLTNKIKIKSLEYASQSFSQSYPNSIGTRFGENIYPYKKSGYSYDYKTKNPFSIYKKSSPYLYLTNNSGISVKGQYSAKTQRGLSIPINKTMSDKFSITLMQVAMRYDKDFFPYDPMQIFEIDSASSTIKFFMVANSSDGNRARIYAINSKTGKLENGILFHLNGSVVSNPVITVKEWAYLGIQFANNPNFDGYVGAINLTAPMVFNSISYYKTTRLQEIQQVENRTWLRIKYNGQDPVDWSYWYDDPTHSFQWGDILYVSTAAYYGVNAEKIYNSYVGTNKTIIDNGQNIMFGLFEYNVYNNVNWNQITVIPV